LATIGVACAPKIREKYFSGRPRWSYRLPKRSPLAVFKGPIHLKGRRKRGMGGKGRGGKLKGRGRGN